MQMFGTILLVAASVRSGPTLAARSAIHPALSQNLGAPPQSCGILLNARSAQQTGRDKYGLTLMEPSPPVDNGSHATQ